MFEGRVLDGVKGVHVRKFERRYLKPYYPDPPLAKAEYETLRPGRAPFTEIRNASMCKPCSVVPATVFLCLQDCQL